MEKAAIAVDYDPFKGRFGTLENLADRISEILKCPITIEDANHQIIAYSTHDDENSDSARIATIMRRRVPENVISSLWKAGAIPKLFESDDPVYIPAIEQVGLGERVAISIKKGGEVLGFVWAQTRNQLTDFETNMLKKAAKAVKNQLLQLQIKKRKAVEGHKEFFWQLLTGHLVIPENITYQAEKLSVDLSGELAIIVFEFEETVHQSLEQQGAYLIEMSTDVHGICKTIDDNQLIFLVRLEGTEQPLTELTRFVKRFIEKMKNLGFSRILAGIGTVHSNPVEITNSYKKALKVLSLKKRFPKDTEGIFSYQELGIFQFLDVLYEKRKLENYQNHCIEQLKAYDAKHKSNLLETIDLYLQYDSNINEAAEALHVHPNTLNYRLKRITEITGLNLKDPNQKTTLYLDLKIESLRDSIL